MKIALIPFTAGLLTLTSLPAATLVEYDFDTQISSTTYADISGNGRDAAFNRNVSTSTVYPFSTSYPDLQGTDLSALTQYNAATSGTVGNISSINLNTTKTFTMEGWVYLNGFTSISGGATGGALWTIASSAGGTSSFSLRYSSTGVVQATFNALSQTGGTRTFDTGMTLSLNTWTYLAYVKTSTAVMVYVNETTYNFSEAGITSRSLPTSLSSIAIGGNIYGNFDDFRLSDIALSGPQLGYYAPFTVPEPGTLALLIPALATFWMCRRRTARPRLPSRCLRHKAAGFSLLELLGAIGIVACLAALLFPVGANYVKKARIAKCTNNLRQMGVAMGSFAADNNGRWTYPEDNRTVPDNTKGTWLTGSIKDSGQWTGIGKLFPYLNDKRIYVCPADTTKSGLVLRNGGLTNEDGTFPCNYVTRGFNQSHNPTSPKFMTLAALGVRAIVSCNFAYAPSNPTGLPLSWHNGIYPVLFADGSVQQMMFPANTVDPKNPPDIWDSTAKQMEVWDFFDGKIARPNL